MKLSKIELCALRILHALNQQGPILRAEIKEVEGEGKGTACRALNFLDARRLIRHLDSDGPGWRIEILPEGLDHIKAFLQLENPTICTHCGGTGRKTS